MDASLKIYGIPQSRASRCLWLARELGVPFENIPVHFNKVRESPELLAINPNARVPAIDDNGFKLYESMAINLYLARKYGAGKDLVPTTPEDEARTIQWSFWVMTEVERPLLALLLHNESRPRLEEAILTQARQSLDRPLAVLEAHLKDCDYLLGDHFTLADLNVASVIRWTRGAKLDLAAYPRIAGWLDRCTSRPAFKG
jgi:glutathione S-transferase